MLGKLQFFKGREVELLEHEDGTEIRGPNGSSIVPAIEPETLGETVKHLTEVGIMEEGATAQSPPRLARTRKLLNDSLQDPTAPRAQPLAVLVDATTYHHAVRAIRDKKLTAYTLLDLNQLAVAAVFFDWVVILPDRFTPRGPLAEFTHVMEIDGDEGDLYQLHGEAVTECVESRDRFQGAWRKLLGNVDLELRFESAWMLHEDVFYAVDVQELSPDADSVKFHEYVERQTIRAVFNDHVAGLLGLPYISSSVRVAAAHDLLLHRRDMLEMLRLVFGDPNAPDASSEYAPYASVRAPVMLGVLMERMRQHGNLDGFGTALKELREETEPFRSLLRKHPDRLQWKDRPQGLFDLSLDRPGNVKSKKAGWVAAEAAAGAMTGPPGTLAVKLAEVALPADEARPRLDRMFRPRVHVVSNLAVEAARLKTVGGQVSEIWGDDLSKPTLKTLDSISRFSSDPLISVRRIQGSPRP